MVTKDLAFVLKRYNFRETSVIVNFYTCKFGKITGILKGFYSAKKEFSSSLEISSLNEIIFYPKKRDIWLISFADLVAGYDFLRCNISKAKTAAFFLEIIDKTMQPLDKNEYIFNLLKTALEVIGREDENKIFYIFLIKFLTLAGVKPEFNRCLACHSPMQEEAFFSVARGGLLCKKCHLTAADYQEITKETVFSLLYIQNNDFNLALRLKPTKACEKEIFYLLQQFLCYHLDFNLH